MGQKVHPLGFRLNTTQKHKSTWFAQPTQYSSLLEQDEKIRNYVTTNYDSAGIADIEIERTYKLNNIFLKIGTSIIRQRIAATKPRIYFNP